MSIIEDRDDYKKNPFFVREYSDFTPFYIVITVCTIIGAFLIVLNIVCCCSKYKKYWQDHHTGNRWLASLWTATPHKQPALDYTELEKGHIPLPVARSSQEQLELELRKRESDI